MAKALIACFSHRGMNYSSGGIIPLKKGNTEVLAEELSRLSGAPLFAIETVDAYPDDYHQTVAVARQELAEKARPALKNSVADMADYQLIYLGFPNWCGTIPMPVATFLTSYDFSGKQIAPFCTHGGGGIGSAVSDIKQLCPKAEVLPALDINGEQAATATTQLQQWLDKLK